MSRRSLRLEGAEAPDYRETENSDSDSNESEDTDDGVLKPVDLARLLYGMIQMCNGRG
jgi:hypothetical protein